MESPSTSRMDDTVSTTKTDGFRISLELIMLPLTPPLDLFDTPPTNFCDEFAHLQYFFVPQQVPEPRVAIIGVGYIGAQLVKAFSRHYIVIAFDLSESRLQEVCQELRGLQITYTVDPAHYGTKLVYSSHIYLK
ncbi:predicted protein [Plenodomus lingam JN3]|uniref:Predicted protein n=1 Tax=Leptosphaeria maculans (strain JN3 / isolate v23.1.3 / race Av1-4-5-6-7-8) TaxID=985895 RepID=E4ZZ36_LEPMJ|nr:predicted protein [Plenodomus lingam JN3]CBX96471.1 predicted protein [Plenodomus lingam JN3]